MKGNRIYKADDLETALAFTPGSYGKVDDKWLCCTPNGMAGNLASHQVQEHEDGTITVSPSILVTGGKDSPCWHGYLERGIWREVE